MVRIVQKMCPPGNRAYGVFMTVILFALGAWNGVSAETLTLGGTGSSLATMQHLAEAYMSMHPETEITVLPSLGSGGGIKAVMKGSVDISMSGRDLKDKERKEGLVAREYAQCPFVFVVQSDNPVSEVALDDILKIFSGETTAWQDGSPIRLILRPERESDVEFLKSLSPEMERAVTAGYTREGMIIAITDQEAADKLEQIPGSFGVSTLCQIKSEGRSLKALALNGIAPTLENMESGRYVHYRRLRLVTVSDPPKHVRKFVEFVFSKEGAEILRQDGSQPVKSL